MSTITPQAQIAAWLKDMLDNEALEFAEDVAAAVDSGERPDLYDRTVDIPISWGPTILSALAANSEMLKALQDLHAFVSVMVGRGADAVIPETINCPLGVPVKIGAIMREASAAIAAQDGA